MEEENYKEYKVVIKVVNSKHDRGPIRMPMHEVVRGVVAEDEDKAAEVAQEILGATKGYVPNKFDFIDVMVVEENYDKIRGNYNRNLTQNYAR